VASARIRAVFRHRLGYRVSAVQAIEMGAYMSFFIPEAVAQSGTAAAPQSGGFINFVLLGGLFIFMYFMIIRPQRKRQKEHRQLCEGLSKGDEVVLNSGMLGKIVEVDDTYVTIKANDSVELKFQKISVHAVLPKGTLKSLLS